MRAPFIRPIRLEGGTFYTFTSAQEDLGFSFNDEFKKFRFSKFVLLDLPDIKRPTSNFENFIQFDAIPAAFHIDGSKSNNVYLAESFQNYCLNLESLIISSNHYDSNQKRTISERVFFKWLKEIGAIRFRQATNLEISDPSFGLKFVEEDESNSYKKVVKYIGDINMVNSTKNKNNAYSEVYIHLPTSHGSHPYILFESIIDSNYFPNLELTNSPTDPLNLPYINEREYNELHPAGLEFKAHFDSEFSTFSASGPPSQPNANFYYFDESSSSWIISTNSGFNWWYPTPKANTYFLEKSTFLNLNNDKFKLDNGIKSVQFKRSRLDGISVIFDEKVYKYLNIDPSITNFGLAAESGLSSNFNFNTILVYYELYDPNNPNDSVHNLFGVLFLDNVDPISGGGGQIPRYIKVKPNELTGNQGNAYSFKINLKFDVNSEDTDVETTINDYNTFSLDLYVDALNELKSISSLFLDTNKMFLELNSKVEELKSLVLNSNLEDINKKIDDLNKLIEDSNTVFANNENLMNLINRNYNEILNIYNNQTSIEVSYNLDVLKEGSGIALEKDLNNKNIKINNNIFGYNNLIKASVLSDFSTLPNSFNYNFKLKQYSNRLLIIDGSYNNPYIVDRDLIIYIDDTDIDWKNGQTIRISFKYGLDMSNANGNFNLYLYTDAKDKLNTGFAYSALIGVVTYEDFNYNNNKPIIEIICINNNTFEFDIDIF